MTKSNIKKDLELLLSQYLEDLTIEGEKTFVLDGNQYKNFLYDLELLISQTIENEK